MDPRIREEIAEGVVRLYDLQYKGRIEDLLAESKTQIINGASTSVVIRRLEDILEIISGRSERKNSNKNNYQLRDLIAKEREELGLSYAKIERRSGISVKTLQRAQCSNLGGISERLLLPVIDYYFKDQPEKYREAMNLLEASKKGDILP